MTCKQCGKDMTVESILFPGIEVCGSCIKKNHKKVAGKQYPKKI